VMSRDPSRTRTSHTLPIPFKMVIDKGRKAAPIG